MPVLSYTYESLQLLFEELGLVLSKPISRLLVWLMIALLEKTRARAHVEVGGGDDMAFFIR